MYKLVCDTKDDKKAKGVKKYVFKKDLKHSHFKDLQF